MTDGMQTRVVELTIRLEVEFSGSYSDEEAEYRYEENFCTGNLINQLKREMDANPRGCLHCTRSERELMPHGTSLEMGDD